MMRFKREKGNVLHEGSERNQLFKFKKKNMALPQFKEISEFLVGHEKRFNGKNASPAGVAQ